ncbi:peptidase M50B-like protein [Tahibacter aquaticus]|uniref:Peptidase M50B-like protein n=1 Tax=Tahibacter aquaticus TaxID=520092 RepID=A0A4R6Z7C1_9GAMM|nr:M50 family metallopeptidase [Tahibacter aquaticus]TDR47687.1 peptidase M50B-like protein [Tahibacter aquaticus]
MSGFSDGWRWTELAGLAVLALVLLVLWQIPGVGLVVYPFRLFGTFVHEISHGLAALATGGNFHRFTVSPDLSGLAWSSGGWGWVISSAGYIGSAVFGGLLILLAARGFTSRGLLIALGLLLAAMCLLFVRNLFGIGTGLGLAALMLLAGYRLRPPWSDLLLLVLALQLVLDGFNSLFTLLRLSAGSNVQTDAMSMAQATGIPALIWTLIWAAISAAMLLFALRAAYRKRAAPAAGA